MYSVKAIIAGIAISLPLTSSLAVDMKKNVSDITVTLSSAGGSVVKATIQNNAAETFKFLKIGTFLDSAPVDKATVFKNGAVLPFKGILVRSKTANLSEEAFASLAPGASTENTFELASVTDLSEGGPYNVIAQGAVPLATPGSTTLSGGKLTFRSNTLSITVDGAAAAKIAPALRTLDERTILTSCDAAQGRSVRDALSRAVTFSNNAANAAASGSASKFQEYFKTTAPSARAIVADRFRGIAAQAGSTRSGNTRYYCTDINGVCSPNNLAYAQPERNVVFNCPAYYTYLPPLSSQCHGQDQVGTTIHEFTHIPATYSPGTKDNGYGYAAATALSSDLAIGNADTYSLYANAIYVGC